MLADDPSIRAFFSITSETDEAFRLSNESEARDVLRTYSAHMSQVYGLLLTAESGRYISNEFYRVTKDPLHKESWYLAATRLESPYPIYSHPIQRNLRNWKNYSIDDVVMLTYPVRDTKTNLLLGAISVDLRLDELANSFSALHTDQNGIIFVLDQTGEVVYAPSTPLVYRVRPEWFQQMKEPFTAQLSGRYMTFLYSTSLYTGWKVIGVFPNDTPPQLLVVMQRSILIVVAIILLFGIIMTLILTDTITRPISYLRQLMLQAECGDLSVHYHPRNSMDVDRLGTSFNTMIDRIRSLMETVIAEQQHKRKAEIDALQAQINPHFLYNTLDTIHWMAKDYQAVDIENMVSALTKLFRLSLAGGQEFVPLLQEIDHAKNYLYIQKVRYEDKLNYRFEVDESLLTCSVLKLMIQPLVENALYHGIKPKLGNGNITVRIFRADAAICFEVIDDGVGITPERLRQIDENLSNREQCSGFGIYNVNERLVMYFGPAYGVRLRQNPSGGAISSLIHPYLGNSPDETEA